MNDCLVEESMKKEYVGFGEWGVWLWELNDVKEKEIVEKGWLNRWWYFILLKDVWMWKKGCGRKKYEDECVWKW